MHILLATDADWIVDEVTNALGGADDSFTVCRDGRVQSEACGPDGRGERQRECVRGQWEDWGECVGAGECEDGDVESRACGINERGEQSRRATRVSL